MNEWSPGDELLRWVSETGSGTWERLRDAAAHVCRKHELRWRPWYLANDISAFGHMDIDWDSRAWSVALPTLNLVPGLGLFVVLTGSRPHYVDKRFEQATDSQQVFPLDIPHTHSPRTKLAKCASVKVAETVAERLESQLVIDPAHGLVASMRRVDESPMAKAAPVPVEEAMKFDAAHVEWSQVEREEPGLYRIDLHGRAVHRRLDEYGKWWSIDLAVGQFLELHTSGKRVLRWARSSDLQPSALEVRQGITLPILAERALRVSSGLPPSRRADGWKRYVNIPRELAERIADRLLQDLQIG